MNEKTSISVYCTKTSMFFDDFSEVDWSNNEFKLFKVKFSLFFPYITELLHYLDFNEINRANRFYFEKDKHRFVIRRAILKILLSYQTGELTDKIGLRNEKGQKPVLEGHPNTHFNISYSDDYALIIIGNRPVGVDIERIKTDFDYNSILPVTFSPSEIAVLSQSKTPTLDFYSFWTRKEAVAKAYGFGINDQIIEIPTMTGISSLPYSWGLDFDYLHIWDFKVEKEYSAALAFPSKIAKSFTIKSYNLPEKFLA